MLSKEDLDRYLDSIPPIPEVLKACKIALDNGDMVQAADMAQKDKALFMHFKNIVNKPIFGFTNELNDARQIFGALGIVRARQIFQSYYTTFITPKKWKIFKLNSAQFNDIQASFIVRWEEILKAYEIKDKDFEAIVTLVPAAIAVCEAIFEDHIDMVTLIKSQKNISYEELLLKFSGYNFFDVVKIIGKKWELQDSLLELLDDLNKIKSSQNLDKNGKILINLILLINYEISLPIAIKSGINDLFELDCDFNQEDVERFYEIMSRAEK